MINTGLVEYRFIGRCQAFALEESFEACVAPIEYQKLTKGSQVAVEENQRQQ
jgi:hypothetical protein